MLSVWLTQAGAAALPELVIAVMEPEGAGLARLAAPAATWQDPAPHAVRARVKMCT